MQGNLQALASGGLTKQSQARDKRPENDGKSAQPTYHLVSIPTGFTVVQLAQNVVRGRCIWDRLAQISHWSQRDKGIQPSLSITTLFSWHSAHCSFHLNSTIWHHHLPASLFLLYFADLSGLPSSQFPPTSQGTVFPFSLVKLETLLITTRASWAPEPWSKKVYNTQKFSYVKRDEEFWLKTMANRQLPHRRNRATVLSWTSFFYLFIIALNWSYLPCPFYRIHRNIHKKPTLILKELVLFEKSKTHWNWSF